MSIYIYPFYSAATYLYGLTTGIFWMFPEPRISMFLAITWTVKVIIAAEENKTKQNKKTPSDSKRSSFVLFWHINPNSPKTFPYLMY